VKSEKANYVIVKAFNHNVVKCFEEKTKKEYLLFGKGIGYKKRAGDHANNDLLQQIYVIKDETNVSNYERLMADSEEKTITVSEEIITKLRLRFGDDYDEKLHVSLLDHLNFSLYRYRNKIPVADLFIDDIESMFPKEYEFAKEMVDYANKMLSVELPKEEISFICMHVYSALNRDNLSELRFYTTVVNRTMSYLEERLEEKMPASGRLERQRLCTHIRFAVKRARENISLQNPLAESIRENYVAGYGIAMELADLMAREFDLHINQGEIGYLALHIQNILLLDEV